ncbi:MAG: hypothetical protein H0V24_11900 [Chloroflexia bacterium]|nr:hypothetical protein [Chloroflexia bacterium]MDQ3410831.1 hypothetical protein [Chloroflexota bacterium]
MSFFDKVKDGLDDVQEAVTEGIDGLQHEAGEVAGHLDRAVDDRQARMQDHPPGEAPGRLAGLHQDAERAAHDAHTRIDDVQRETSGHLSRLGQDADTAAADLRHAADTIEHAAHDGIDDARTKVDHAAADAKARVDKTI